MRRTDFWDRMSETFGASYSRHVAADQALTQLGGRTVNAALADGVDTAEVWRAVVVQYEERVPKPLRR